MDKSELVETVARKTADHGAEVPPETIGQVIDALFGTVERAGAIAEGLRRGETVALLGFGDFHIEETQPALRPGAALSQYVNSTD
ncbi:HU family DNA-binding protein [Streptomyces sp. NPDC058576]|uniref:HU family DNA-binding protein n=1 Tax=Streptomyces sp. NPDC058576 TaxID=3346547 RepID=UPI0036591D8A